MSVSQVPAAAIFVISNRFADLEEIDRGDYRCVALLGGMQIFGDFSFDVLPLYAGR